MCIFTFNHGNLLWPPVLNDFLVNEQITDYSCSLFFFFFPFVWSHSSDTCNLQHSSATNAYMQLQKVKRVLSATGRELLYRFNKMCSFVYLKKKKKISTRKESEFSHPKHLVLCQYLDANLSLWYTVDYNVWKLKPAVVWKPPSFFSQVYFRVQLLQNSDLSSIGAANTI